MFFIVSTVIILIVSIKIASIASAVFLMIYFKMKRHTQKMTSEKWEQYFEKIGPRGVLIRVVICYSIALVFLAYVDTILFWQRNFIYGITLIIAGIFHVVYRYMTQKNELKEAMKQLK